MLTKKIFFFRILSEKMIWEKEEKKRKINSKDKRDGE